ncbi:MAG: tetratricopeptide repeat protein [Proteobacteria bacterium]|nr:tetratricopeptide repeat protein [Pseudomonadota bacterium]
MNTLEQKLKIKLEKAIKSYKAGNYIEAETLFRECVKKKPYGAATAEAWYYLGLIAYRSKNYEIAVEHFNAAIKINVEEKYFLDLGLALYQLKKYNALEECYLRLLSINPDSSTYNCNLGVTYSEQNQLEKAIDCYKKALVINPENADAYSNMGFALKRQNKIFEAKECYFKAIELNPKHATAYYNLGIAYKDTMQIKESIKCYRKVLELNPQYPEVYFDLAIALLLDRDFEAGWEAYEKRITVQQINKIMSPLLKPQWNGESLEGKSIYVLPEQGFGDIIQFSRFLPYLKKLGANRVFFKSRPETISLFEESKLLGAEIIGADGESVLDIFDYYIPLLSLAYYLKVNEYNIPFTDKYLHASKRKINKYQKKFFDNDKYKVGIFWQGSKTNLGDAQRSLVLKYFYPIFSYDNVAVYSIQKGFGSEQLDELPDEYKIVNLGNEFNDFSDTAAAIENLDLVISVDSSVAHLAGALGKEVWIILSEKPEWRWGQEEDLTIWYKNARLFRPAFGAGKHETMSRVFKALDKKLTNLSLFKHN